MRRRMKPDVDSLDSPQGNVAGALSSRLLLGILRLHTAASRALRRCISAIKTIFDREAERGLRQRVLRVIEDLEVLNRSTEEECLKIGEELTALIRSVQSIRSGLDCLTDMMSGESTERTEAALSEALTQSLATRASSKDDSSKVSEMRKTLAPIKSELARFEVTITTFRLIAMLTRIETSRLAGTGSEFENLANELTLLAASLEENVKSSLELADSLISPIDRALADLAAIETDQAANLPLMIGDVSAQLSLFHAKLRDTRKLSSGLGARYEDITASFRQVVVSLQTHDATRQHVEHVIQTLRCLLELPEQSTAHHVAFQAGFHISAREKRTFASILSLQSLQLEHASSRFAVSVAAIMKSLDGVATHMREISEESRALMTLSENEGADMVGVEKGFIAVLAGLQKCAKASSANAETEMYLQAAIGSMRKPILDIQMSELQILKLSMNANICAARAGSSGDCLGVLAVSVQKLAVDSKERSDFLMSSLSSAAASQTCAAVEGSREMADCPDPIMVFAMPTEWLSELRQGVADLQLSSTRSWETLTDVVVSGKRISDELEATCGGLRFAPVFAESMGRVRNAMEQISAEVLSGATSPNQRGLSQDISGIKTFYTMQCERDVHEAFEAGKMGFLPVEQSDPMDELSVGRESDVEFF